MLTSPLFRSASAFAPSLRTALHLRTSGGFASRNVRTSPALNVATAVPSASCMSTVADVIPTLNLPQKYGHFIGGKFIEPIDGQYFTNVSPINGQEYIEAARGSAADIDMAVSAAQNAFDSTWKHTSVADRSNMLLKIATIIEDNAERLAKIECVDNGKPIREANAADLLLMVDHFRYYAGVIRAEEGTATEIDVNTVSLCIQEPIGVVGQIIPWNFPLLMAAWKLAPALAAGNCVVLKPAEQTPTSIMALMELIKDVVPPGVVNVVTGYGDEAGAALAQNKGISKLAFTGSTGTGSSILHEAANNLIPTTLELGGKSPNIFFSSIMDQDDELLDKAVEGAVLFAFNQGEEKFMKRVIARTEAIKLGDPLDPETMMGAQVSMAQYDRVMNYLDIGKAEGATILTGGANDELGPGYVKPTILAGTNDMRVFQEEIFGPVTSALTFKTAEEAIEIANAVEYGLGAGVWTRDTHQAYQVPRAIQAGRVWVNCYHAYPAHAPFGGYKKSGFGRETHKMMLNHYRQTKNMLISYDKNKLGFF